MSLMPRRVCRDLDDDSAPVDYSFVSSANEAARQRQQQNIKRDAPAPRRPDEVREINGFGRDVRMQPEQSPARQPVARKLPSAADGAPSVARVAYPDDYGIPDNPFEPPKQPPRRVNVGTRVVESAARDESARPATRRSRVAAPSAENPPVIEQNGAQFEPPASLEVPEWLRVAQQNQLSCEERRARAPRVQSAPPAQQQELMSAPVPTDPLGRPLRSAMPQPAPKSGNLYEDAGYPPELLREQERLERERDELNRRRRHGAQYAVTPPAAEESTRAPRPYGAPERAPYARAAQPAAANGYTASDPRQAPQNNAYAGDTSDPRSSAPYARRQAAYAPDPAAAPVEQQSYSRQSGYASQAEPPYQGDQPRARARTYAAAAQQEPPQTRRPLRANGYVPDNEPRARETAQAHSDLAAAPYQVVDDRWQDEESDQLPAYEERPPVPWLAIAMFVAAFVAVGLWLLQLTFTSQTEAVLRAREEVNETLLSKHPYHYRDMIEQYASKNNISPAFVAAIILNESSFNPNAVSNVGARGLMQLMDDTASWIHEKMGTVVPYSFDEMFTETTNLEYGCWYLAFLCDRFRGDPVLVSAAFHAGQNTVQNWLNSSQYSTDGLTIELENMMDGPTKQYATRVVRDYSIYKGIYYTEDIT